LIMENAGRKARPGTLAFGARPRGPIGSIAGPMSGRAILPDGCGDLLTHVRTHGSEQPVQRDIVAP